ncbi:hypothetical protein CDD83_4627 [Cordyceps sp. RAO-2017]|nr:hypothetical protein CDD83_4627 [Cordyceps sp. RAO-2017]
MAFAGPPSSPGSGPPTSSRTATGSVFGPPTGSVFGTQTSSGSGPPISSVFGTPISSDSRPLSSYGFPYFEPPPSSRPPTGFGRHPTAPPLSFTDRGRKPPCVAGKAICRWFHDDKLPVGCREFPATRFDSRLKRTNVLARVSAPDGPRGRIRFESGTTLDGFATTLNMTGDPAPLRVRAWSGCRDSRIRDAYHEMDFGGDCPFADSYLFCYWNEGTKVEPHQEKLCSNAGLGLKECVAIVGECRHEKDMGKMRTCITDYAT